MPLIAPEPGDPLDAVRALFAQRGSLMYSERVTQLEHALQCATLATAAGAGDELITAALLHDIGHLLHPDCTAAWFRGEDDRHEVLGARFVARWFGPAVWHPVALHVQARRYACTRDADSLRSLAPSCRRALALQGGPLDMDEAESFVRCAHAHVALALHAWDHAADRPGAGTPPLPYFMAIAERCLRRQGCGAGAG